MPSDTYAIDEPFEVTRGDDFVLPIDFGGEDVSTNTYRAQARTSRTAEDSFDFSVDSSQAATGWVTIHLSKADTRLMTENTYLFDVEEETAGGLVVTLFYATIKMRDDVTR